MMKPRTFLRHMKRAGWSAVVVNDDPGSSWEDPDTTTRGDPALGTGILKEADAMAAIESVDWSNVLFEDNDGNTHAVAIILSNGDDWLSDYGCADGDPDGFAKAVDGACS